jgi:hypothetical protein
MTLDVKCSEVFRSVNEHIVNISCPSKSGLMNKHIVKHIVDA